MRQRSKWQSSIIWLFVIIILPIPLLLLLNQQLVDTASHLRAADTGVLAYSWWLGATILAARPHWLVGRLNLKAVYTVHGLLGLLALVAATVHRQSEFSFQPSIKLTGNIAWWLSLAGMIVAIIFLSGWLIDFWPTLARAKSWLLRHGLRHQLVMWLHRLNLVCIALIWLHVNLIPQVSSLRAFMTGFNLSTLITALIYGASKVLPNRRSQRAVVKVNQALNSATRRLVVNLNRSCSIQPGTTFFLRFPGVHGLRKAHPFSLVQASSSGQAQELEFIIRQNGDDTKRLSQIKPGAPVAIEGPFGDFARLVAEALQQDHPVVLYGMGTGIAPLHNLSQHFAGQGQLHVIWSYSREADRFPAIDQQLRTLAATGHFSYTPVKGRMTTARWQQLLTPQEIATGDLIIVGAGPAVLHVEAQLQKLGLKRQQLHDERLTM